MVLSTLKKPVEVLGTTLATLATLALAYRVKVELYCYLLNRSKSEKLLPYRDIAAMKLNNEAGNWLEAPALMLPGSTGNPPTGDNRNTATEQGGSGPCMSDEVGECTCAELFFPSL